MSSHIKMTINKDGEISIANLHWTEYRHIMLAIETTNHILNREITDSFSLNEDRKKLAIKMNALYANLHSDGFPSKGMAISLDEEIIKSCLK